ncbi:unnamed protein product [Chironomus riparius]|uniref:Nucleoporin NUP53 n=1 Tax=Chironomus riparius TaxID=315576 RepID=A0A9N9WRX3_9DIPT|nr:unnamed protein product [Chironomus riparius]
MEKMQLGSPASSPAQNSYLPNFLMGIENTPTNRSFSNSPTASPDFNRSNLQQRFLTGLQSPNAAFPNQNTSINQPSIQAQAVYQSQNNNNTSISGPPINSLFDNLRNDKSFQTPSKSFYQPQAIHQDTPQLNNSGFNQSRVFSPIPHTFNDFNSSYNMGPGPVNQSFNINNNVSMAGNVNRFNQSDFWVTVFGFPAEAITAVLSHFSGCGTILEKVCSSGNWIHLRFSSKGECDKALLYNGKIIGNNLMIGVIRCQDDSVIEKENTVDVSRASINKIRSLTQAAYKSAKVEHEVLPANDDPKKTTGIVNKAMDLLFGW